ncbi:MAG TPA: DEAD/DEAH box helicase [Polyangiaceae bacterium]|nr:DEAD/DEAH box helicase [Polyangiaceae bacterium]
MRAVTQEGYEKPTPIQAQAVPEVLGGHDLLATAQTGTGKTAAFLLPILQRLSGKKSNAIRTLILSPTRELAAQIAERADAYGRHLGLRNAVIYGGVGQGAQEAALKRGIDVLVATPGRLLDLMSQGLVRLSGVEHFVLDEADRMFDMGFIHDVRRVVAALPHERQTLLFSATMPKDVVELSKNILKNPRRVAVEPQTTSAKTVTQSLYLVSRQQKSQLLHHVLAGDDVTRTIVFTRTKHGANRVSDQLQRKGIGAAAIHGNKSQSARVRALDAFKRGTLPVLVATDIAARGIDVDEVSHVINYDLPNVPESYVHRIGRTGRAGASGHAISFCEPDERSELHAIERLLGHRIPLLKAELPPLPPEPPRAELPQQGRHDGQGRDGRGHHGRGHHDARASHGGERRDARDGNRPQAQAGAGGQRPQQGGAGNRPQGGVVARSNGNGVRSFRPAGQGGPRRGGGGAQRRRGPAR